MNFTPKPTGAPFVRAPQGRIEATYGRNALPHMAQLVKQPQHGRLASIVDADEAGEPTPDPDLRRTVVREAAVIPDLELDVHCANHLSASSGTVASPVPVDGMGPLRLSPSPERGSYLLTCAWCSSVSATTRTQAQGAAQGAGRGQGHGPAQGKGLHNGGPEKFGCRYVRDAKGRTDRDEPLELHPAEGAVVRRILAGLEAGVSQKPIAPDLNPRACRPSGGRWYQGTVGNIARDPFYAGLIDVDSELVAGQRPALIDAATHQRIKAVLVHRDDLPRGSASSNAPPGSGLSEAGYTAAWSRPGRTATGRATPPRRPSLRRRLREIARYEEQLADAETLHDAEARIAEWSAEPDVDAAIKRLGSIAKLIEQRLEQADGIAGAPRAPRRRVHDPQRPPGHHCLLPAARQPGRRVAAALAAASFFWRAGTSQRRSVPWRGSQSGSRDQNGMSSSEATVAPVARW